MASPQRDRFTRLVRDLSPAVGDYLRRRMYPLTLSDVDDLVEETFLVVWRRLDDVPLDAELPWTIGVARNILRNTRRAHGRRFNFEQSLGPVPSGPSAEDHVIADESVRAALNQLSDDDRELVVLHAWDGLDSHGLAVILNVTPNAAAVRLSRALARFRVAINETEVD